MWSKESNPVSKQALRGLVFSLPALNRIYQNENFVFHHYFIQWCRIKLFFIIFNHFICLSWRGSFLYSLLLENDLFGFFSQMLKIKRWNMPTFPFITFWTRLWGQNVVLDLQYFFLTPTRTECRALLRVSHSFSLKMEESKPADWIFHRDANVFHSCITADSSCERPSAAWIQMLFPLLIHIVHSSRSQRRR